MKRFLITLMLMTGLMAYSFGQKLTYQSVIRDNAQQLVSSTAVKAQLTIHFADETSYDTTINATTSLHGLLSLEFGNPVFYEKDWQNATVSVVVSNAATQALVYLNSQHRPVNAVPYALTVNGNSIQNYLDEHSYLDLEQVRTEIRDTANVLRERITAAGQVSTCTDVVNCVNSELSSGTSTLNQAIDTVVSNGISHYLDTSAHFVNTINNYIDSSSHYVNSVVNIVDSSTVIRNYIDEIIMDSLSRHYNAQALCDSVGTCISGTVNSIIDTSSHITNRFDNYVDTSRHFSLAVNNIIDSSFAC